MNNTQMHLHSENFDLCRICLLEPESNRQVKFMHIFSAPTSDGIKLNQQMLELLDVKIEKDDIKPKILCENCYKSLLCWTEMKKKATESQIVINYIAKKRFGCSESEINNSTSNVSHSWNNQELTNTSQSSIKSQDILDNSVTKSSTQTNSFCNSHNEGNSIQSTVTNDSDDDSCKEVTVDSEVISISDSEESVDNNFQAEFLNNVELKELSYCSICRKKNNPNHDCSQYNTEFSTCLVPNCNILFRSITDFIIHYKPHYNISMGALLCLNCYQEKNSEHNAYDCHNRTLNLFKCYTCNFTFKSMLEFANHKLKSHNCQLLNSASSYLCFYCEISSPDMIHINEHIQHCRKNQTKSVPTNFTEIKNKTNKTELLMDKKDDIKEKIVVINKNKEKVSSISQQLLFTCLKPTCNLIFQSFPVFKFHYRKHFEIGDQFMCWQCCTPFSSVNSLRSHQTNDNCRTPLMFNCFMCSGQFDDIQSLSIHKYTMHDGDLICKNKKSIVCSFCKVISNIDNFKNHLVKCQYKIKKKSTPSAFLKKARCSYKCVVCGKVCLTAAALSSHVKVHDPNSRKNTAANKINNINNSIQKNIQLTNTNISNDEVVNLALPSTSQNIEKSESITNSNTSQTDTLPLIDNFYFCLKCPKKFNSKKGLSKHWSYCSTVNVSTNENLPQNYYCTRCNEFYTRLAFSEHWKKVHGKRLPCNKYKRYSCPKCSLKFIYKIALLMHVEHLHSEIESLNDTTFVSDGEVNLPITSGMTSIVESNTENSMENCNIKNVGQCKLSVAEEIQNEIEYGINEKNNEPIDTINNDINDDENNIDNTVMLMSNNVVKNLKQLINEMDNSLLLPDTANKVEKNSEETAVHENNVSSVTEQKNQNNLLKVETINNIPIINNIKSENKIINQIDKLPILNEENQEINELNDHPIIDSNQVESIFEINNQNRNL